MNIPEENLPALFRREQQQSTRTGCSRRTFLLGGVSIGGAIAALTAGGWWLHTPSLQPPVVVPVDKHRILSLPLSGKSAPRPFQNLPSVQYAWLSDSIHLAVAIPDKIFLVNVRTGQTVWQQTRSLQKEQNAILLVNWSTNGKQIQTVQESGVPGGQIAWPAPSQMYNHNPSEWNPREFAFSADRTYLAFIRSTRDSEDSKVQIWNIPQKSLVARYQDPEDTIDTPLFDVALSWSPTSPSLAIFTNHRQPEIHLWQAGEKRLLWTTDLSTLKDQANRAMKWSSDGLSLAYAWESGGAVGVLDAQTDTIRFQTTMALTSSEAIGEAFAWSPDGTRLAFFANEQNKPTLQVWQAHTGQHLFTCQRVQGSLGLVRGGVGSPDIGEPGIVSWSPDGKYLVARTLPENKPAQATLQFWDAHTGEALFSYQAPYEDDFLSWSPHLLWSLDSHFLAAYMVTSADCLVPSGFPGHPRCSYTFALQVFQVG